MQLSSITVLGQGPRVGDGAPQPLDSLHRGEIDLAILPGPVEGGGHRVVFLFEEKVESFFRFAAFLRAIPLLPFLYFVCWL